MTQGARNILTNYRGGLAGVILYLGITIIVYFAAFMAVFGNPTPLARAFLNFVEIYAIAAHPLWGIPIAYILGAYCIRRGAHGSPEVARA